MRLYSTANTITNFASKFRTRHPGPTSGLAGAFSKVRGVRDRHGIFLELERLLIAQIVLRAGPFLDGAVDFLQTRHPRPRRFEGAGILHRDDGLESIYG